MPSMRGSTMKGGFANDKEDLTDELLPVQDDNRIPAA